MDFNIMHLSLDINYKKACIYIRASIEKDEKIKDYNIDDRVEIQNELEVVLL